MITSFRYADTKTLGFWKRVSPSKSGLSLSRDCLLLTAIGGGFIHRCFDGETTAIFSLTIHLSTESRNNNGTGLQNAYRYKGYQLLAFSEAQDKFKQIGEARNLKNYTGTKTEILLRP